MFSTGELRRLHGPGRSVQVPLLNSPFMVVDLPAGPLVDHVVSKMLTSATPGKIVRGSGMLSKSPRVSAIPSRVSPRVLTTRVLEEIDSDSRLGTRLDRLALHSSFVVGAQEKQTVEALAAAASVPRDWLDLTLNPLGDQCRVPLPQDPGAVNLPPASCEKYALPAVWRVLHGPAPEYALRILRNSKAATIAAKAVAGVDWDWASLDDAQQTRLLEALPNHLPGALAGAAERSDDVPVVGPYRVGNLGWASKRAGAVKTGRALYDVVGEDPGLWDVAMELLSESLSIDEWLDTVSALT